jgi:serine/threonine protein kinase
MLSEQTESFDGDKSLQDVVLAYLQAVDAGEQPDQEEWLARYPHLAAGLRVFFSGQHEIQAGIAPLRQAFEPEPSPPFSKRSAPEQFGRYRILKRLGKGGMGSVYLAHDTQLDRRVALKVPHFGPEDGSQVLARFYQEARAAATIQHPHICPVYDVGEIHGTHYLTMAYIEGKPLTTFIDPARLPTARQVAALVRKLALALQKAHEAGVIHRDLKPSNIMINKSGEPVIVDFGLARRANQDEQLTQVGMILGTPCYMPPEQVRGDIDAMGPAADIYSLGVIMYQLLTGLLPFEGERWAVLDQIMVDEPPPPSRRRVDVDPALESICSKAMAKQIKHRYGSMGALAEVLTDYLRGEGRGVRGEKAGAVVSPVASRPSPLSKSHTSTPASPSRNATEERQQPSSTPSDDKMWLFAGNESIVAESYLQAVRRARRKKRVVLGVLFGGLLHIAAIIGLVIYLWPQLMNSTEPETGIHTVQVAKGGSEADHSNKSSSQTIGQTTLEVSHGKKSSSPSAERRRWVHDRGSFTNVKDNQWVELRCLQNRDSVSWFRKNYFVQVDHTPAYVELQSKTPPVQVRLYDASCKVKFGNEPFKELYRGKWDREWKATNTQPPDGFVSLFNGKDLTGWQLPSGGTGKWKVQDGAIVSDGPMSYLFSQRGDYQDFHLRAEVQINDGGNSGLYFRIQKASGRPKGYEAQINATHQDPQKTGSLYGIEKIRDQLHKPDEWFTLDVIAEGEHIIIRVNDKKVVDVTNSKYRKGYIALQQFEEGTVVRFRRIEIQELNPQTPEIKPEPVPTSPPEDEGQAILDKAIAAHGGLANLAKFQAETWNFKGIFNTGAQPLRISGESFYELSGRSRVVFRNSERTVIRIEILNGYTGWIKENGITRAMDTEELAEAKEGAYADTFSWLFPLKEKSFALSPLGEMQVEGRPAVGLRVSRSGHREAKLFFDKESARLVKVERPVKDDLSRHLVNQEIFVSKHKEIEGIWYPQRMRILRDGKLHIDITISGYNRKEKWDDSLFVKP